MKQKTIIKTEYYADDGKVFTNKTECELYESNVKTPEINLYSVIDKLDAKAVVNYIDLIMGQYNVIKNSEIRDVKIKHMLTKLQDEFKHYISDN